MSLHDQLAADLESILTVDELSESFTYLPKSGQSRTIVGDVVREVEEDVDPRFKAMVETASVTVLRDPVKGIDNPRRGDQIRCSDGAMFTWQEKITDQDSAGWVLHFKRADLKSQGGVR